MKDENSVVLNHPLIISLLLLSSQSSSITIFVKSVVFIIIMKILFIDELNSGYDYIPLLWNFVFSGVKCTFLTCLIFCVPITISLYT